MQILAYARLCVDGTVAATGLWQRALQWELSTGREGHLPGCIGWRDGPGDSAARIEAPMELRKLNTDDRRGRLCKWGNVSVKAVESHQKLVDVELVDLSGQSSTPVGRTVAHEL